MMRTLAVSRALNLLEPTKLSVNTRTLAESVSFTKSKGTGQMKSSSHFFTVVVFRRGVLAKNVMDSMGKLPVSHWILKATVSPSSTVSTLLTDGFTFEGMISVL